jgi:L-alanine-DL-glutamate epimerase-like enolase superfamily enzyme
MSEPGPGSSLKLIETFVQEPVGIVRVTTADGRQGIGQIAPKMADISATVLHRQVAPLAMGQSTADPDALVHHVWERLYKFHGTYVARALGGLDTALWDLNAKRAGVPVWKMLGGRPGPLRAYGSSMDRSRSVDEELAELRQACERNGFTALKFKIGARRSSRDPLGEPRTIELVKLARQTFGEGFDLLVDANGSYSPERAIEIGHLLEAHGICHYEEPCPHDELEQTAEVAAALSVPVAGGEQDYMLPQFRRMFAMRALDIAQLDVCYVGGFSRALRVARMASEHGLPCTPHASNHSMVFVFTMHLLAAIDNPGQYIEYGIRGRADHFEPVFEARNGLVPLPTDPGWGVRIRQEWLDRAQRTVSDTSAATADP